MTALPGSAAGAMRILLVQPLRYLLTAGGAHKANRMLIAGLAARGHVCRVLAVMGADEAVETSAPFVAELHRLGLPIVDASADEVVFCDGAVTVHAVRTIMQLGTSLVRRLHGDLPTHVIVSEDSSLLLVESALCESEARVVYLCHSQTTLPFGPASFIKVPADPAVLRAADGVLTVSHYVRRYLEVHAGVTATVHYFPSYGAGPFADLGQPDRGEVTLINPSAIKGLSIFLALARRLPEVRFAAVPSWATTAADRAALAAMPNVAVIAPVADVDQLYVRTRVLLVPSLWGESFGQVVVEAMLRGVPVLAADAGGLPEAKLGVDHLLPVRPIEAYQEATDDRSIPLPIVPAQDVEEWATALGTLLADPARYRALAAESRRAAHAFVAGLTFAAFEDYLASLPAPARGGRRRAAHIKAVAHQQLTQGLTLERRALLAARLRRKRGPGGAPRERG